MLTLLANNPQKVSFNEICLNRAAGSIHHRHQTTAEMSRRFHFAWHPTPHLTVPPHFSCGFLSPGTNCVTCRVSMSRPWPWLQSLCWRELCSDHGQHAALQPSLCSCSDRARDTVMDGTQIGINCAAEERYSNQLDSTRHTSLKLKIRNGIYISAVSCPQLVLFWVCSCVCLLHGIMGRRFPDGGLLRYRKWVPQQLGYVIDVTTSPPIGHMRSQLTNHQVGIVIDVQAWSEKLY